MSHRAQSRAMEMHPLGSVNLFHCAQIVRRAAHSVAVAQLPLISDPALDPAADDFALDIHVVNLHLPAVDLQAGEDLLAGRLPAK